VSDIQGQDTLFSSASVEWGTPQYIFDALDKEFGFTVDAAASPGNAKCARWYGKQRDGSFVDGLKQDWSGEVVWINPPYSRQDNLPWARKIYESAKLGATVVGLVPARVDTRWWNQYYAYANDVRFVEGRIPFVQKGKDNGATFPSAIIIFQGDVNSEPYQHVTQWKQPKI
jgi:phage N-6-adenine-methyltransferase